MKVDFWLKKVRWGELELEVMKPTSSERRKQDKKYKKNRVGNRCRDVITKRRRIELHVEAPQNFG